MLLIFSRAAAAESGLPGAEIPLQPMRETTVMHVLYLSPWTITVEHKSTLHLMENNMLQQADTC